MGVSAKGPIPYLIIAAGIVSMAWLAWYLWPEPVPEADSVEALRAVLETGSSPEARAEAAAKLGDMAEAASKRGDMPDEQSMPLLFRAMEDPDPMVRGQAGVAVQKIMKADYYFRAEDPPEQRQAILARIKQDWEAYLKNIRPQPAASAGSEAVP